MNIVFKFMVPGIVFLLTLASGFWLSHAGKPLNTIIFTIHKLIALGAVVSMGMQVTKLLNGGGVQALLIISIIVTSLSVIALFATGALMSMDKPAYAAFLVIHQVAIGLVILGGVGMVTLLAGRIA